MERTGCDRFLDRGIVLWNRNLNSSYFKMRLSLSGSLCCARPGQFIMLQIENRIAPLLRRPFSIYRMEGEKELEILYRVVGEGTKILSEVKKDESVGVLGPLGNGFSLPVKDGKVFIVAGGIGVAPLAFLCSYLVGVKGFSAKSIKVFLGARSKEDLLCRDDFSELAIEAEFATEDGSEGETCMITSPVEAALQKARPDVIYACGPSGMMKCLSEISEKYGVTCQISMETIMACGFGACLGCAVESKDENKYLHVCKDGPVFDSRIIRF